MRLKILALATLPVLLIAAFLSIPTIEVGKVPSPMPPIASESGERKGSTFDPCHWGGTKAPDSAARNEGFTARLNRLFPPGTSPDRLEARLRSEGFEITPCEHDTGTIVAKYEGDVPGRGAVWVVYSTWPDDELQWSLGWVQIAK